jgi:hypothetical protein
VRSDPNQGIALSHDCVDRDEMSAAGSMCTIPVALILWRHVVAAVEAHRVSLGASPNRGKT